MSKRGADMVSAGQTDQIIINLGSPILPPTDMSGEPPAFRHQRNLKRKCQRQVGL